MEIINTVQQARELKRSAAEGLATLTKQAKLK